MCSANPRTRQQTRPDPECWRRWERCHHPLGQSARSATKDYRRWIRSRQRRREPTAQFEQTVLPVNAVSRIRAHEKDFSSAALSIGPAAHPVPLIFSSLPNFQIMPTLGSTGVKITSLSKLKSRHLRIPSATFWLEIIDTRNSATFEMPDLEKV